MKQRESPTRESVSQSGSEQTSEQGFVSFTNLFIDLQQTGERSFINFTNVFIDLHTEPIHARYNGKIPGCSD